MQSFVTHDRCEGTSSPLSSGCARLTDKDALSVIGSAVCMTFLSHRVDCNKEQMCYLETFYLLSLSNLLLFWQHWPSGALHGRRCQRFHFDRAYPGAAAQTQRMYLLFMWKSVVPDRWRCGSSLFIPWLWQMSTPTPKADAAQVSRRTHPSVQHQTDGRCSQCSYFPFSPLFLAVCQQSIKYFYMQNGVAHRGLTDPSTQSRPIYAVYGPCPGLRATEWLDQSTGDWFCMPLSSC